MGSSSSTPAAEMSSRNSWNDYGEYRNSNPATSSTERRDYRLLESGTTEPSVGMRNIPNYSTVSLASPSTPSYSPAPRDIPNNINSDYSTYQFEMDTARAIQLSLRQNNQATVPPSLSRYTSSVSTLNRRANPASVLASNTNSLLNPTIRPNSAATKPTATQGEVTFDCSICMDFNANYVIVAAECGHIFHKECITPWIQSSGNCPTCRTRISAASLRKLFASVNSKPSTSTQSTSTPSTSTPSTSTPSTSTPSTSTPSRSRGANIRTNNNNNNNINQRRNNPNRTTTSPVMYRRTIWLSSQDKQMTETSLETYLTQVFYLKSHQFTIKSLKKVGSTRPAQRYVSFKISVDTEITFNRLNNNANWPTMFRVREFVERN